MRAFPAGVICLLTMACSSNQDVAARYNLEKKMWKAQSIERKIRIDYLRASESQMELAISAYKEVLENDPLEGRELQRWDPKIVQDIKRLLLLSRIALADLFFLSDRYYMAGMYYKGTIADESIPFRSRINARLNFARTLYFMGAEESMELQCEAIFKEITLGEDFWKSNLGIKDAFLNIPLVLLKIYKGRGDQDKYDEYDILAESFYNKIIMVWPDSLIAEKSRLKKINLYILRQQWEKAIFDLEGMILSPFGSAIEPRLLLMEGKIYLNGLGRMDKAEELFTAISRRAPGSDEAYASRLEIASIHFRKYRDEEAEKILKELEKNHSAPENVRSGAMLLRALYLEGEEEWSESKLILRRIQRLYPGTPAAMEAPLLITRHYLAVGDTVMAVRSLEKAREFYISFIERKKRKPERSLIAEDFLVENYLLLGKTTEIAFILASEAAEWGWPNGASALVKSARIYATLANDKQKAAEALKKCIALYPQTRYAKKARELLEELTIN